MVALLRAVNVGGGGKLPMADLRAVATECGFDDVATYVQSGNLVFTTREDDGAVVAATLRAALAAATGVDTDVMVRTRGELRNVVDANPFVDRTDDPTRLHVVFTAETAEVPDLDATAFLPEEVAAIGRELYLYLPGGIGRSKLAVRVTGRKGPRGTARNWRTVTTLLEMVSER